MTISLKDFSRCCRCCLTTVDQMKPMFGASLDQMLIKLTNLQITQNDGYPQQMCNRCIRKVSSAHTFYLTVVKSQKILEDILKAANKNEELFTKKDCDANNLKVPKSPKREINMQENVNSIQCLLSAQETRQEDRLAPENQSKTSSDSDNEESYQCAQCHNVTKDQEELKAHIQTHQIGATDQLSGKKDVCTQLCYLCGARFRLRTSLLKHLRQHRGLYHQCQHCDKKFAEVSTLNVHLVSHSADPKPFRCACGLTFAQKSALKNHEKVHEERATLKCDCGKSFLYKSSLQRHCEHVHLLQECQICKNNYNGTKLLKKHMKCHAAEMTSREAQEDHSMTEEINIQAVTVEFLCLLCSKKFQTREGLEVHDCIREEIS